MGSKKKYIHYIKFNINNGQSVYYDHFFSDNKIPFVKELHKRIIEVVKKEGDFQFGMESICTFLNN